MLSSTHEPSSEVDTELQAWLSWNPPRLSPPTDKKLSLSTRSPAFFDKHFSDNLILHRVERLPSLTHAIATTVDLAITAASNNNIQLSPHALLSSRQRDRLVENLELTMADEKAVANFYNLTTATHCACVASTLTLHPGASSSDWRSLLVWTQSSVVTGYAIADGCLKLIDPQEGNDVLRAKRALLLDAMDEETRRIYNIMLQRCPALASWGLKNVAAGDRDVMLAIPNLSNMPKFDWTTCSSGSCLTSPWHEKERCRVERVRVGPDAKESPWNVDQLETPQFGQSSTSVQSTSSIPSSSRTKGSSQMHAPSLGNMELATSAKRTRGGKGENANSPSSIPKKSRLVASSQPSSRRSSRLALKSMPRPPLPTKTSLGGKKEKGLTWMSMPPPPLPIETSEIFGSQKKGGKALESMPPPPLLVDTSIFGSKKGKEKALESDDGDDWDRDPSFKDKYDLSAQSIVQQAWAQAVRIDGTIIVMQSGNYEFIGIRHRASNTLYISDLIEPPTCQDPAYWKLHVGIYIAAIQDAMDRARQLLGSGQPGNGEEPSDSHEDRDSVAGGMSGGRHSSGGDPGSGHPGSGGNSKIGRSGNSGGMGSVAEKNVTNMYKALTTQRTIDVVNRRDVVLLYLQYGIYDSPKPAVFLRSSLPIFSVDPIANLPRSRQPIKSYQLHDCLTIVLKSEIGHGATGVVLRGMLHVEASDDYDLLDVTVKLGFTHRQQEALRNEFETYCWLKVKGVCTGIIEPLGLFDDSEMGALALVMPYAGIPLTTGSVLPISHREAALATLRAIHRAGILHGDLRRDNLLLDASGLTIIDFSHSRRCDDQEARDKEYSHLQSLFKQVKSNLVR